jgi:hypothetical protein
MGSIVSAPDPSYRSSLQSYEVAKSAHVQKYTFLVYMANVADLQRLEIDRWSIMN